MIPSIGSTLPRIDTARIGGTAGNNVAIAGAATASGQPDFASVMAQVTSEAVNTMKNAETVSVQGLNGQASTQAVVDAVMGAERTLQTAVTIRDKVVSAYQELSRMAI